MKPPSPDSAPRRNPFEVLREKLGDSLPRALEPAPRAEGPGPAEGKGVARKGEIRRVTVRRERAGRGGKTVTIAEGPGFTGRRLEELAREAGRALGVGARVEGATLVVQGDQCERLATWLGGRGFERVERGN